MALIATIIVVFIFIIVSFQLYVRYRRQNQVVITIQRRRPTRPTAAVAEGLDAAAIASLPAFVYSVGSPTHECRDQCAVCLSAAEEGEMMRMLPECKHVFHIECVDMWLHSHSTCPVCRTRAKPTTKCELEELLVAPPLPESFGHGDVGGDAREDGSEPSQVCRMGNGSRRSPSTVDDGVVDLERQ